MKIANKHKRQLEYEKLKKQKAKDKLQKRQQQKKENAPKQVPLTIEMKREPNDSPEAILATNQPHPEPKVVITTNQKFTSNYDFVHEFTKIFPTGKFVQRKRYKIQDIIDLIKAEYSHLCIINEDRKQLQGIHIVQLPNGPTHYYKLTNIKLTKEIAHHGNTGNHLPELILNGFTTELGSKVGNLFMSMFPSKPEFEKREAVTFHCQRDFIFFRKHRYIFRNGEKVDVQELGPRFTLKLYELQEGTFNPNGKFEFEWKPDMGVSRKKFYL